MADYRIMKYPLTDYTTTLQLPIGSRIFTAERVRGEKVVYAIVDQAQRVTEPRVIKLIGTSSRGAMPNPNALAFVGTIISEDEQSVLHAFEDCS